MLKRFFGRSKSLKEALNETKKVKVQGVLFTIRKLNPMDFLTGSKILMKSYDTYEGKRKDEKSSGGLSEKKIMEFYKDVLMSGVVKPELSRKENDGTKVYVDEIFKDWEMVEGLYLEIMSLTYGKKKVRSAISQRVN